MRYCLFHHSVKVGKDLCKLSKVYLSALMRKLYTILHKI